VVLPPVPVGALPPLPVGALPPEPLAVLPPLPVGALPPVPPEVLDSGAQPFANQTSERAKMVPDAMAEKRSLGMSGLLDARGANVRANLCGGVR
jgi:hypothetical protein